MEGLSVVGVVGKHLVDHRNLLIRPISRCLNQYIEDSAHIFCRQLFWFYYVLNFSHKLVVDFSVHCVIIDVSHLREKFKELYHIWVSKLIKLRKDIFNQLAVEFAWSLACIREALHYLDIVVGNKFFDFTKHNTLKPDKNLTRNIWNAADGLYCERHSSWLHRRAFYLDSFYYCATSFCHQFLIDAHAI